MPFQPMNCMKRGFLIIGLLVIAGGVVALLMSNQQQQRTRLAAAQRKLPVTVATTPVRDQTLTGSAEYTGTTDPWREVPLTATTQGIVRELGVSLNQTVRAGQLVLRVDTDLLQISLRAAEATLQKNRADLSRYQTLQGEDNATAVETETARLQVATAESQVQTLQKQIQDATVLAPIGGTVTEKPVERGLFIAPGTPLLTITDVSAVKLVIGVPEADLSRFSPGRVVAVSFDAYPDQSFQGTVHTIRLKGAEVGRFPVEIRVTSPDRAHPLGQHPLGQHPLGQRPLRVGMAGTVTLPDAPIAGLTIPRTALITQSQRPAVYVLKNRKVALRSIETGRTSGASLFVRQGLSAGEQVVVSGTDELRNGQTVVATLNQ